jgi:hypothetical protein
MSSKQYDNKLLRHYEQRGPSAAILAGQRMGLPFGYCVPCEWHSPIVTLDDGARVCGVCGTAYEHAPP